MLKADNLYHGGIMVNYQCTAACRHCLYACSPSRRPGYINREMVQNISVLLRRVRCTSVHIGGGEPFLNFNGLLTTVQELLHGGIPVDYIETNAFWAGEDDAADKLRSLLDVGADTLCISIDPYHAEYVPYGYPLQLARLCEKTGMGYFLWRQEFLPLFSALSPNQTHNHAELKQKIGDDYVWRTARAYGIHFGGRAINIEKETGEKKSSKELVDGDVCKNLLSGNHFHVDPEGFFIPPGCTGLRLPLGELVCGISEGTYPVFETLYHRGLAGLLSLARESGGEPSLAFARSAGDTGFVEDQGGYSSKCALCFHVRHFLASRGFAELDLNHFEESLKYY
jgi:hypothetical protein